jgi:hypothetical protein
MGHREPEGIWGFVFKTHLCDDTYLVMSSSSSSSFFFLFFKSWFFGCVCY